MKKLVAVLAGLTVMCCMFAQGVRQAEREIDNETFEAEKTKTETIIPKEQHITDNFASVKIEYQPMFDQVRIYYETNYVTYDKGAAMNTVLECLADFQVDHQYSRYRYLKDDKEKYFKDEKGKRRAQYISTVQFVR
ncbi:MAG: hypothetical protein MJ162_05645 [Treponema sp.]|nr:hypothetical protein [Treponema sp.]